MSKHTSHSVQLAKNDVSLLNISKHQNSLLKKKQGQRQAKTGRETERERDMKRQKIKTVENLISTLNMIYIFISILKEISRMYMKRIWKLYDPSSIFQHEENNLVDRDDVTNKKKHKRRQWEWMNAVGISSFISICGRIRNKLKNKWMLN